MANARGQSVDKTYLSLEQAAERGFIHRDYLAHCLRWTHVIKRLTERKQYEGAVILDVGCGRELPLATTLYSSRLIPRKYIGVDVGPVNDSAMARFHTNKFVIDIYEKTDIMEIYPPDLGQQLATHVTCFEMIEHIEPKHLIKVLDRIKTLCTPTATLWFSTPCWNGQDTAANHVNEIKYGALAALFEASGYQIVSAHGTFASIRDYQDVIERNEGMRNIFNALRNYYDVNFLSCIFAPMFPERSRNCLWELRPLPYPLAQAERSYPGILTVPTPWGSSEQWRDLERPAPTTTVATLSNSTQKKIIATS